MPLIYREAGFLKAAEEGKIEALAQYLARDDRARFLAARDSNGRSALHLAASRGQTDAVELLLNAGMKIDEKAKNGSTPLAWATSAQCAGTMRALLARGADPALGTIGGKPLLPHLLSNRYNLTKDAAMALLESPRADLEAGEPLRTAIANGHFDMAALLLAKGAKMPPPSVAEEATALHKVAQAGHAELLEALIDKGADINAVTADGHTPLHYAVFNGQTAAAECLVRHGARVDLEDKDGHTAVGAARGRSNRLLLKLLEPLEKKAIAQATTAITATGTALPEQDTETWLRMGDHQAARVGVYPLLGRRLTEIFNFESCERFIISENLKTGAETVTPPVPFDQIAEPALEKARTAFAALGGDPVVAAPAALPGKPYRPQPPGQG